MSIAEEDAGKDSPVLLHTWGSDKIGRAESALCTRRTDPARRSPSLDCNPI